MVGWIRSDSMGQGSLGKGRNRWEQERNVGRVDLRGWERAVVLGLKDRGSGRILSGLQYEHCMLLGEVGEAFSQSALQ